MCSMWLRTVSFSFKFWLTVTDIGWARFLINGGPCLRSYLKSWFCVTFSDVRESFAIGETTREYITMESREQKVGGPHAKRCVRGSSTYQGAARCPPQRNPICKYFRKAKNTWYVALMFHSGFSAWKVTASLCLILHKSMNCLLEVVWTFFSIIDAQNLLKGVTCLRMSYSRVSSHHCWCNMLVLPAMCRKPYHSVWIICDGPVHRLKWSWSLSQCRALTSRPHAGWQNYDTEEADASTLWAS